jgi:hypothetical protein
MREDKGVVIQKERDLAHAILKELKARGVNHKAERFEASGWSDKLDLTIDGTEVRVEINPEKSGTNWHRSFTGKLRISVQDGGYDPSAKRHQERKNGFDVPAICDSIVTRAKEIEAKRARREREENETATMQAAAQEINKALGLTPYQSDVYVREEGRRLVVEITHFTNTMYARKVAEAVRGVLMQAPKGVL